MVTRSHARWAGPRPILVAVLLVAAPTAACSRGLEVSMSEPAAVTPAPAAAVPTGTGAGPTDGPTGRPSDGTSAPVTDPMTDPVAEPAPEEPASSARAWGGGRKVGRSTTRGTVGGDDGSGPVKRIVVGTCDAARDVRTVSATLEAGALLVIDVTSANLAKITLTAPDQPERSAEYVGDATPVVTLTPSRTIVRDALLVPPAGSDADPVRVDASFDC